MKVFKVVFANNEVISCKEVTETAVLSGNYQYEHEKGKMIYAIIKAESESDARKISDLLVKEVNESIFGTDYIN